MPMRVDRMMTRLFPSPAFTPDCAPEEFFETASKLYAASR